jgi:hypothetical protein
MRFPRLRREVSDEEDEEVMSRVRRLMRRPRAGIGGGDPSKEAVMIYVNNGLNLLRRHLEALGASDDELRRAIELGKKALLESYPDPVNLEELAKELLGWVRSPRGKPRS